MNQIAEIVTFTLAVGVEDTDFLASARKTNNLIESQPGFLSRQLSKGSDGRWTDYTLWKDQYSIDAAHKVLMQDKAFLKFIGLIDQATLNMRHEPTLLKAA